MKDIAEQIEQARLSLALPGTLLRLLPAEEGKAIFERVEARFVTTTGRTWWWEDFRLPGTSHHFTDGNGWRYLTALVPFVTETVWFIVVDRYPRSCSPVYEASTATAQAVIGQCDPFEYYLVARDLSWLLGESHSDVVFAVGEPIETNLRQIAERQAA